MCHILRKEDGPAIPVSTRSPVFPHKLPEKLPRQDSSVRYMDEFPCKCSPRIRAAIVWPEARISQNTCLSQESDSHIYAVSIPPRSCKSLESRFDRHMRIVKRRKPAIHHSVTKEYED